MRFAACSALKDLRRHARDPLALVLWVCIPVLIGALSVGVVGGTGGPAPQAHVLVADRDESWLSVALVGALSQDAASSFIRAERVEESEGRARMEQGDASALLVIPAGFGECVLEEKPVALQLVTNPSQQILPRIVEEALRIFIDASFYLHRILGDEIRSLAKESTESEAALPDERIASFAVKVNQVVKRLRGTLIPPVIKFEAAVAGDEAKQAGPGLAFHFLPAMLFMTILFISQSLSADMWRERDQRTLRRVVVSPGHVIAFFAGKVAAGSIVLLAACSVALLAGYGYFGITFRTLPAALAWTTLSGAVLLSGFMLLQLFTTSHRAGNLLSTAVALPLLMLGGSFFPFPLMPDWMAAAGRLTPNGWALERLTEIALERVDGPTLAASFASLIPVLALLFFLGARRLQARFATE